MSGLTKDQLRNELINHGVKLPSPSARKDEYVRLYRKFVAPLVSSKGEFSSDDEDHPLNDLRVEATEFTSMIINGIDVTQLDDDDLFTRLQGLGATVGPIVDTTRKVYQRKLYVLMGGELPDQLTFNGDVDDDDEYSDNEEEVVEEPVSARRSARNVESSRTSTSFTTHTTNITTPQATTIADIRKRVLMSSGGGGSEDESVTYDPDIHTPSPRRSLRTVTATASETTTVRKMVNNGRSDGISNIFNTIRPLSGRTDYYHNTKRHSGGVMADDGDEVDGAGTKPGKMSMCLRLIVKLIFLALIMVLALYCYQNTSSESPFKAVEQLARQALESAAGKEAVDTAITGDGPSPANPAPPPSPATPPQAQEEQRVFP